MPLVIMLFILVFMLTPGWPGYAAGVIALALLLGRYLRQNDRDYLG